MHLHRLYLVNFFDAESAAMEGQRDQIEMTSLTSLQRSIQLPCSADFIYRV